MAKKFVRGITDIKTINNQDFDTNNVNDLLSDGKHNYIHRKKSDGSEEYHNLTNNLKTIQSDDTDLLTVTNYNNTTNSATIRPKHDSQKEQLLESTDETILISHGENGTEETTTVDVNPAKVLEHDNLLTGYGLRKEFNNNQTSLMMDTPSVDDGFDLNNLNSGLVRASYFTNAPIDGVPFYVVALGTVTGSVFQIAFKRVNSAGELNQMFLRTKMVGNTWTNWKQYGTDNETLNTILGGKQNTLTSNASIGVSGTGLRQLYTNTETYTHTNAFLKTHVKSVSQNTSVSTVEEEFHFLAKMDKSATSASFTLNEHDTAVFEYLIDTYGLNGTVNIHGSAFSLNYSTLTFLNNTGAQYNPHIITFSDIIPTSAINTTQSVTVEKVDEILDETVETEKVEEIADKTE